MKKRLLLLGISLLTVVSSVSADPEISEKADTPRYARLHTSITHPQSGGSKYSSVSSSVVQSTQSPVKNALPTTPKTTSSQSSGSVKGTPANVQYSVQEQLQPPTANAQHFIFQQSANGAAQGFIPTAGPMLMQILTPQGQPTGQVQYIQFLRPVMVPVVPQTYMQAALQSSIAQQSPLAQAQTSSAGVIAQQYLPTTTPQPLNGGFYPYAQQPLGAFSSPVASYYHPNIYSTNRVQVVNGPADLSLNTDEYMPAAASEMTYKVMKPVIRS